LPGKTGISRSFFPDRERSQKTDQQGRPAWGADSGLAGRWRVSIRRPRKGRSPRRQFSDMVDTYSHVNEIQPCRISKKQTILPGKTEKIQKQK
jgi:hypothetical protein